MNGTTPLAKRRPAIQLLTKIKEEVVVQYILDLDSRGFPPWVKDIRDMADYILATRGSRRIGKQWPYRFV